jgi:hypothetical protein
MVDLAELGLEGRSTDSAGPVLHRAEVLAAPVALGEPLSVRLLSEPRELRHEIRDWAPCGSVLPKVGDVGLVAADDEGRMWLTEWVPSRMDSGGPGGAANDVRHIQSEARTTWTIDWPETRAVPPHVTTVVGGSVVIADVSYDETARTVTVTFGEATSGLAFLT